MNEGQNDACAGEQQPRKRSVTSLTLGWIADRLRKAESLKERVNSGEYCVDSAQIARSLMNDDDGASP